MFNLKTLPQPLTILMVVIVLAAAATWLVPAGEYSKLRMVDKKSFSMSTATGDTLLPATQKTLDNLGLRIPVGKFLDGEVLKPVSVPNTYREQSSNPQGFIAIIQAPIKGIYDSIDIIMFILVMGGFVFVFNETKAIEKGVSSLTHTMHDKGPYLIAVLTFLFSFCKASYGMDEEALMFYPILVPVFLAAGYDLLVPFAVIFGGNTVGGIAAFSNPFSTIIASNAAGINWKDGIYERLILFVLTTALFTWYLLRYAKKVKNDPSASLVYKIDGIVKPPYDVNIKAQDPSEKLDTKTKLLLLIFLGAFLAMIGGTMFLQWWTLELSALLFFAAILVGFLAKVNERVFVSSFVKGAESLLSVAFIVGVARGVTIILNDGHISDSILYYMSSLVAHFHPALFLLLLLIFFIFFSLFITSTSGMAVLTMPIIGTLAVLINIPGSEIVNAYLYGMNLMFFISPTAMLLPSLALVNVSLKVWIRFIMPLLVVLFFVCALYLVGSIYL